MQELLPRGPISAAFMLARRAGAFVNLGLFGIVKGLAYMDVGT